MRSDKNVNAFLQSYEIAPAARKEIDYCIHELKSVITNSTVRNIPSMRYFFEIQLKLMKDEVMLSLCFSIGLFALLQFLERILNLTLHMDTVIGIAPFLIVPVFLSIIKSKRARMFEMEAVSWLGMNRNIVIKLSINQMLAIVLILLVWIMASISGGMFLFNRFLFSMILFEGTLIGMLLLGKFSINGAAIIVTTLMITTLYLSRSTVILLWVYHMNSILLGLITVLTIIFGQFIVKSYANKISFENEVLEWNLG